MNNSRLQERQQTKKQIFIYPNRRVSNNYLKLSVSIISGGYVLFRQGRNVIGHGMSR